MQEMKEYILALDQSTSGTKAILIDRAGALAGRSDLAHRQIVTPEGWAEHDPMEIWANVPAVSRLVMERCGVGPGQIRAIAIANQRETAVCWRRSTGLPLYNAVTWQCARAEELTWALSTRETEARVRAVTGLRLSPYFSAAKFSWLLKNVGDVARAASEEDLCFGTVDAWLIYRLTRGVSFRTDVSNASRTQLLDLDSLDWSPEMLGLFGIERRMLPEVCESNSLFGYSDLDGLLPEPVPICGVLGDSQAALLGNGCLDRGGAKLTLGTGTSVMVNAGSARPRLSGGVVESVGWKLNGRLCYVAEGNINYTGALIVWLKDRLCLIENSRDVGPIAAGLEDNGGVYLVPAFTGLGAPHWRGDVRAAILGLGIGSGREHIIRAAEEAVAYQIADVYGELTSSCGPIPLIFADGGAKHDTFLMQFTADMLGCELAPSEVEELSALGAGCAAMLALGWTDETGLSHRRHLPCFRPTMEPARRERCYKGWKRAVRTLL